MSVHAVKKGGWVVRYREASGRMRSKSFARKGDANAFDTDIKRRRQLGPVLAADLDREAMSLADFVAGPWRAHAATLTEPTRLKYAWALDHHLAELVDEPLAALTVVRLAEHRRFLLEHKRKPRTASTVREAMAKLSGVLQYAAETGYLPANPVRTLRPIPADDREEVQVLAPVVLERVLAGFEGRDRVLVVLGGYLGLRPQEIRKVPWSSFNGETLTIGRVHTKRSARRTRTLDVPVEAARELKAWRLASGGRDADPIVGDMTPNALRLWGTKRLRPAVAAAGGPQAATVYMLRHTHASAVHYAAFTLAEAARRMGHAQQTHTLYYTHVIESIRGERYADLDAMIAAARALMFDQSSIAEEAGQ